MDIRDETEFGCNQGFAHRGHKRAKHVNIVARRNNNDNGDCKTREVLLILEVTVNGQ